MSDEVTPVVCGHARIFGIGLGKNLIGIVCEDCGHAWRTTGHADNAKNAPKDITYALRRGRALVNHCQTNQFFENLRRTT